MSLHCVYSAAHGTATGALPKQLAPGDCVLLLGDASVLALPGTPWLDALGDWPIYALKEDLVARGIDATDERVERIDYDGWLALAEQQANQRLWR